MELYKTTVSSCPTCASDVPGYYQEDQSGIYLSIDCRKHGTFQEKVENDPAFFKKAYEYEGYRKMSYLILPVTYRCNLRCKYCYAHANYKHAIPDDRSLDHIMSLVRKVNCPTVNLAGGEPTVREDLAQLVRKSKELAGVERICVVTNGQRTADFDYLRSLKESGLDFLFFPVYIVGYEKNLLVKRNMAQSLQNSLDLKLPVWIQATIDSLEQLTEAIELIRQYRKIIFNVTIRAAKSFGIVHTKNHIFISEILRYLGKENDYYMGNHPFNRHIRLFGKSTKVSSWVNDRKMVDPYDAFYVLSDDSIIPFHKGMLMEDLFFKTQKSHC
jgi:organic radical activating enzyme